MEREEEIFTFSIYSSIYGRLHNTDVLIILKIKIKFKDTVLLPTWLLDQSWDNYNFIYYLILLSQLSN